jgi:tetratricopeptide (TPR) repeat protein
LDPHAFDPPAKSKRDKITEFSVPGWAGGVVLVLGVLVVYLPALRGQFVWDDDSWTSNIVHLLRDFSGLREMWCRLTALQQYYPISGTTFWIDYHLWGFRALPYHVENVLLHALAALLAWRLLVRLRFPGAWLVAALFAFHPVMVESAGWITERKNVLSLTLYLGALLAYARFSGFLGSPSSPGAELEKAPPFPRSEAKGESRRRKGLGSGTTAASIVHPIEAFTGSTNWPVFGLALVLFILAMLAKTTAFSLPPVLLLLAWWKGGRLRWREDILPTVPFFAVAISQGCVTAWVERHSLGTSGPEWSIPFPERCLIAGRALWFYAGKIFWPANLCFIYPRWEPDRHSLVQWLFPASAAAVVLALWLWRSRIGRGPVTGVLFFIGTLSPLLGFMNAYFMRYSFVCDHWTYLPSFGLITLGVGLLVHGAAKLNRPLLLPIVGTVLVVVLGVLTWRQTHMYRDMETLWRTTLAKNPKAAIAEINLAYLFYQKGNAPEAVVHFNKALELQPLSVDAHSNLAAALMTLGRLDEAISHLRRAIELQPTAANAHNNLGNALLRKGNASEAVVEFRKAIELGPDLHGGGQYNRLSNSSLQAGRHYNLGNALIQNGEEDEAVAQFRIALQLQPSMAPAHVTIGRILLRKGLLDQAEAQFQGALSIRPGMAEAHLDLAAVQLQKRNPEKAVVEFQRALAIDPNLATARLNLGTALLNLGRVDDAITQLSLAVKLQPSLAEAHYSLANAFFRNGRPQEGIAGYEAALALQATSPQLLNNLAWALATCPEESLRDGHRAVELARKADQLSGNNNPQILGTLAAALAETGNFSEAIAADQRAIGLATAQTNATLVEALRARLASYQASLPFRDLKLRSLERGSP